MSTHEDFSREEIVEGGSERSFGLVFTTFFAIVGLWPLLDGAPPRGWALMMAALFLILAITRPSLLVPLNRLWKKLGLALHKIVNPIVMGLIFFVCITPMGLIGRLFGRDALKLKLEPNGGSYWIRREPFGPDPKSMKNQF